MFLEDDLEAVYRGLEAFASRFGFAEPGSGAKDGRKFVFGAEFTVFDILAFCEILQLNLVGVDVEGRFKGIWEWIMRCKAVCADLVPVHALVGKISEKRGFKFWLA